MLLDLNKIIIRELSAQLQRLSKIDKERFHPHEFDVDSLMNLLKERGNHYYIYRNNKGEFCGYGMLRTFEKYEFPTLGCVIWNKFRGKGHGDELVKELIEKGAELGFDKIKLKVHPRNNVAISTYENNGFRKIGINEDGFIWMEYNRE
jgi:ribosomal protein S18 acetylase RimI-like enzyme